MDATRLTSNGRDCETPTMQRPLASVCVGLLCVVSLTTASSSASASSFRLGVPFEASGPPLP